MEAGGLEVGERRELYSGFGDSLALAFEFAATPSLFGWIGYFIDRRLGTTPWLTIALVIFALAGLTVRIYYRYVAAMAEHERSAPWRKVSPPKQSLVGELDGASADRPRQDVRPSQDVQSRIGSGADGFPAEP